jgi:hypothetical protein
VRRISQTDPGGHSKPSLAMVCFNLIDIDNFVSVEEDEMNGFFRFLRKVFQEGLRLSSQIELAENKLPQFNPFETQKIISCLWILPDKTKVGEGGKEAMGRSFRKFDFGRQIPDAYSPRTPAQDVNQGRNTVNRLNKIARLYGLIGHFIVSQYGMSFLIIVILKILSRSFFCLPTPTFQFTGSPRCRGPGRASWRGFIGRLFFPRTIIARYPIEESMERRQYNLTLYDAAS